jgi:hypothetical protein
MVEQANYNKLCHSTLTKNVICEVLDIAKYGW